MQPSGTRTLRLHHRAHHRRVFTLWARYGSVCPPRAVCPQRTLLATPPTALHLKPPSHANASICTAGATNSHVRPRSTRCRSDVPPRTIVPPRTKLTCCYPPAIRLFGAHYVVRCAVRLMHTRCPPPQGVNKPVKHSTLPGSGMRSREANLQHTHKSHT
eukprot:2345092-Rhodomonas_salina.2